MRRIRDCLMARPDRVLWLIGAYYVVAVVVRVLRTEGLQSDEAEQLFQSQYLLWGYGRQPPFYNWIQYGVIQLIGPSILAVSLVKNSFLFLSCLFYGLAARQISTRNEVPAAAMLGVLALPAITVLAQRDLTHATATLFAVSFFLYAFLSTLTRPNLWGYALTGLAIGIGALSKYNFVVVPFAALAAVLAEPDLRRRVLDRRVLLTGAVAALICLPHGFWFLHNVQTATAGTLESMRDDATGRFLFDRIHGLAMFAISAVDGSFVVFVFLLIAFRRDLVDSWKQQTLWTRVIGRMLLVCLLSIVVIAVGVGATKMTQKWLSPFLLLLPLYLCLKLEATGSFVRRPDGIARLTVPSLALAFGFLVYLTGGNVVAPLLGDYQKDSLPTVPFLRQVLTDGGEADRPRYIVTDSMILAGSARIVAPDVPILTSSSLARDLPPAGRGLVVWQDRHGADIPVVMASSLRQTGINLADVEPMSAEITYPFSRGRKVASFNYAWIARP
jgi:4-amino-4-deoxy-L-arabinose transferase-like glycosyltransferase